MITNDLIKDVKFGSNITDGEEFKDLLEVIASVVCDSVVKTLGPYAATTIIDGGATTYSTKDGWSVVNTLRFGDPIENTLFKFIKDISFSLNSKVGDGTTTAIVAAKMFIDIFRKWLDDQRKNPDAPYHYVRQADILDKINEAGEEICKRLKSKKRLKSIKNPNDIYKIANISTNGNETISSMIKEIYAKTSNPNIHVTLNIGGPTYYDIQNGYKLDSTLLNPNCHINTSEETCVFTKPVKIVMFNHNVTYAEHSALVTTLINNAIDTQDTIVIMAPYFDDIIMSILNTTLRQWANAGKKISFVLVQVPMATTLQKCFLNDFCVLCGMEMFDSPKVKMFNHFLNTENHPDNEDKFDDFKYLAEVSKVTSIDDILNCVIGTANKLTIGKKFTLLEEFNKTTDMYKNMMTEIEKAYNAERAKADSTKNYLSLDYSSAHMRYVKFSGCTGTIYVGGESELSCKCLKDAVDDAVLACRSAYENGYIRGMNIETISVITEIITELKKNNKDNTLLCECYKMIGRVFTGVTREVMFNKYRNEGFNSEDLENMHWNYEYHSNSTKLNEKFNEKIQNSNAKRRYDSSESKNMVSCIIDTCVELGLEYNLITETFGPAGYSVINSVSTDIEVIKATTNILSLLLSSNQLISLNKMCDKKIGKEQMLNDQKTKAQAIATGVVDVINKSGLKINFGGQLHGQILE